MLENSLTLSEKHIASPGKTFTGEFSQEPRSTIAINAIPVTCSATQNFVLTTLRTPSLGFQKTLESKFSFLTLGINVVASCKLGTTYTNQ
jgi:hypothetical protein